MPAREDWSRAVLGLWLGRASWDKAVIVFLLILFSRVT